MDFFDLGIRVLGVVTIIFGIYLLRKGKADFFLRGANTPLITLTGWRTRLMGIIVVGGGVIEIIIGWSFLRLMTFMKIAGIGLVGILIAQLIIDRLESKHKEKPKRDIE
jgi:hypothetical protein